MSAPVDNFTALFTKENLAALLFGGGAITCYTLSFMEISKFVGDKLTWYSLKAPIASIWWKCILGSFLLFITAVLYFINDTTKTMYFIIALACITLCISYASLAICAITKTS
jgi:hypothetical protein